MRKKFKIEEIIFFGSRARSEHLEESDYDFIIISEDFKKLGFFVYGMHGLKFLRCERASIRIPPKKLWLVISDISQKFTYYFPKLAFQLLAVKYITDKI